MKNWQSLDYSPLRQKGSRWWQSRGFLISFSINTVIYVLIITSAASSGMSYNDSLDFYPFVTSFYIIALVITLVVVTTNSEKARTLSRLSDFAVANELSLEVYTGRGTGQSEGLDVTTNSVLLETLHEILRGDGQNKKLWELRGEYDGVSFKIYTLQLAIRFVGGSPRWYHAGVIEVDSRNALSPALYLSKQDWLSSYLHDSELENAGMQKIGLLYDEHSKEQYGVFKPYGSMSSDMKHVDISQKLKASKRSIEFAPKELFVIKNDGHLIEEKEMKQTFELLDEATKLLRIL